MAHSSHHEPQEQIYVLAVPSPGQQFIFLPGAWEERSGSATSKGWAVIITQGHQSYSQWPQSILTGRILDPIGRETGSFPHTFQWVITNQSSNQTIIAVTLLKAPVQQAVGLLPGIPVLRRGRAKDCFEFLVGYVVSLGSFWTTEWESVSKPDQTKPVSVMWSPGVCYVILKTCLECWFDGSVGEDTCCQAWRPGFSPLHHHHPPRTPKVKRKHMWPHIQISVEEHNVFISIRRYTFASQMMLAQLPGHPYSSQSQKLMAALPNT